MCAESLKGVNIKELMRGQQGRARVQLLGRLVKSDEIGLTEEVNKECLI
jgi:hypothetical protein